VDDNYSDTPKAVLTTRQNISLANVAPNYWPVHLYQACRYVEEPGASLLYTFQVDAQLDYQIWLHFAEIDPNITKPGERVFNVSVNDEVAFEALDIFKTVGGGNAALDLLYTVHNLTGDLLNVTLTPVDGSPLICGLEILALLPSDIATNATQGNYFLVSGFEGISRKWPISVASRSNPTTSNPTTLSTAVLMM
jgi:hypothetical protein